MADIILDNIYLILLLPLWIFLIIMSARFLLFMLITELFIH